MNRYKNLTDQTLHIIGVGTVEAGAILETEQLVENPNLQPVGSDAPVEGELVSRPAAQVAAPAITPQLPQSASPEAN